MNMDRRDFLRIAATVSVAAALPAAFAAGSAESKRRLLILVELKGGNDGLNTVVPYADPLYARLRPRLALPRDQLLTLTEQAALHPSLEKLMPTWQDGKLAIVQGLGYPQPNLSHFRSIEIWDTASKSEEYLEEGWLARAFAQSPSPAEFISDGVAVGTADLGPLAGSRARAIALTNPEGFLRNARLARPEGEARNAALRHILKVENDVQQSARRITAGHEFNAQFPNGPFGIAARTAAQLAANPAGVAAIRVSLSGFDTHTNQLNAHANLLRQVAEGLAGLRAALEEAGRWDSTVIATYSEFGRRPRENQSNGTDHGTAGAQWVMGGSVKGGLYGAAPALDRLDGNGNLPFAVDFRSYYATFLDRWWSIDARTVLGGRFENLDLLS
jgi:uncharacterized protein (DUF1501 family)